MYSARAETNPTYPVASFWESTHTATIGTPIDFNASASYDPDGIIVRYHWFFGDGTEAFGVTTSHAYLVPGEYVVILIVTDDRGHVDTATGFKTITPLDQVIPETPFGTITTVLTMLLGLAVFLYKRT